MIATVQSGRFASAAPAINPLTLATFAHAYYAEGAEFTALSYANGATLTTVPDEIATADLTNDTTCTYATSRAALGNQPAWVSAASRLKTAAYTSIPIPYTIVAVAEGIAPAKLLVSGNTGDTVWAFYSDAGSWKAQAGNTLAGGTVNTSKHLFVFIANGNPNSKLIVDGVTLATGNGGTVASNGLGLFGLVTTTSFNITGSAAFLGIAPSVLDATALGNLLSWSQGKYGTP